jgi:beta-glucosidase/6-phospho-beta-glucosidase/beta-galactosidase
VAVKWWLFKKGRKILHSQSLDRLLDLVYERPAELPLDYIAIDYYDPFVGHIFRFPRFEEFGIAYTSLRGWLVNSVTSKQWDWPALPQGLGFFVRLYEGEFPEFPLIIAENGMARLRLQAWEKSWRKDQMKRAEYLQRHLEEVQRLRREGSRLVGYFHWSLTDNYEWGTYAPRFGLYHIDLASEELQRQPGVAVEIYRKFVAENG